MNFSEKHVRERYKKLISPGLRRVRAFQVFLLRFGFFLMVVAAGVGIYFGYKAIGDIFAEVPDIKTVDLNSTGLRTQLIDDKSGTFYTLGISDLSSEYTMIDQIPKDLQNAFVAALDPKFFTHDGVDVAGFVRSVLESVATGKTLPKSTFTITELLLKNQVFSETSPTDLAGSVKSALKQKYLALKTEVRYTKDEILEYFLNTVSMGQNTVGVGAASKRYFGKDITELTLPECAALAATALNPSSYNPIFHHTRNQNKELQILMSMQDYGFITSDQYEEAITEEVQPMAVRYNTEYVKDQKVNPFFVDLLIKTVTDDLKTELGYTDTQALRAIYTGGLKIYTTLDPYMQRIVDEEIEDENNYPTGTEFWPYYQLVVRHSNDTSTLYNYSDVKKWYTDRGEKAPDRVKGQKKADKLIEPFRRSMSAGGEVVSESLQMIPEPQVSFVIADQKNGAIKAISGGRGEKPESMSINRAADASRQPGTALTLLSTGVSALDTAGMNLGYVQDDTRYKYPGTETFVQNEHRDTYRGLTTLRDALLDSINVISVKTLVQITPRVSYDYLKHLGFTTLVDGYSDESGSKSTDMALSLALGELKNGVNNLELSLAYAAVANGGIYHNPLLYTKIVDREGNTLIDRSDDEGTRVMKDSTAWLIGDVMHESVSEGRPDSMSFKKSDMAIAGRSGMSGEHKDLWFVGYTPHLTAGIWSGYDQGKEMTETAYHKDIWENIMGRISKEQEVVRSFEMPKGITSAKICTKCGKLAVDGLCDNTVGGDCVRTELFTTETLPTANCDCHVKCRICRSSGLLAGDACPEDDVYEAVYLLKKDEDPAVGITLDAPAIMPDYLIDSVCTVHGS